MSGLGFDRLTAQAVRRALGQRLVEEIEKVEARRAKRAEAELAKGLGEWSDERDVWDDDRDEAIIVGLRRALNIVRYARK